jgi:PAS domain S-box-containing protein
MSENEAAEQIVTKRDKTIALLEGGGHFDALVTGVEDYAIFLLSSQGSVISWNTGAERIKGYKREEIIGKHYSIFYPPEARERNRPGAILRAAARDGRCTDEGWRVRKDGSQFWANVVLTAIRDETGALRGFLKITRDLSERRQLEVLQMADRQKDKLLATVSHELRTHLNAILGWVNLMLESRNDEAVISQGLDVLQRNTETLTELISGLLDLSRIATGTFNLNFEAVDLKELVCSSVETMQIQAARRGVALKSVVEIPPNAACRVCADKVGLQQVLANILSNALKFTPKGGTVTAYLSKVQATAILAVKDTGIGMSADFLPRAFDQFAQDKPGQTETRGMGLGLAICKHLVERHDGSIAAESEGTGRGTTITVKLPLLASSPSPGSELSGANLFPDETGVPDHRLSGIKVVAVDDDADTRELLKFILERSSADAIVVGSGKEALKAIRNFRPNILVCDLAMSQMDGYELLENVRRLEPEISPLPSIAFTASARNEDRIQSRQVGFQAHLVKPAIAEQLVMTIVDLVKPGSS